MVLLCLADIHYRATQILVANMLTLLYPILSISLWVSIQPIRSRSPTWLTHMKISYPSFKRQLLLVSKDSVYIATQNPNDGQACGCWLKNERH